MIPYDPRRKRRSLGPRAAKDSPKHSIAQLRRASASLEDLVDVARVGLLGLLLLLVAGGLLGRLGGLLGRGLGHCVEGASACER